jgi:ribosomal protein S8
MFKKIGLLNSYYIYTLKNTRFKKIKVSPLFYKDSSFFKKVKLVSTPSKTFSINLNSLRIVAHSLGTTIVILETSRGLLTHKEALNQKIGGRILFVIN